MDVSICIVNYNSSELITRSIASIVEFTKGVKYQIIVVNNSPGDNGLDDLFNLYPNTDLQIIQNDDNLGFGAANNIGFKKASGKYFLSYNPDLFLMEDSITSCYNYLESDAETHCLTVKFNYEDGSSQASGFFKDKGAYFLESLFPFTTKLIGKRNVGGPSVNENIVTIDVAVGAFLFVKSSTYEKIGGYDERFFLYGEDWEISNRILKEGEIKLLNTTTVIHMHGGVSETEFEEEGNTIQLMSRKGIQMMVSVLLWQRLEFGVVTSYKLLLRILFEITIQKIKNHPNKVTIPNYFKSLFTYKKEFILMLFMVNRSYKTM